ncbi:MAG: prenyltransferase, partial [Silvibacterium sp.]
MSQVILEELVPVTSRRPLCVDLDGTLVKSDTLVDSLLLLVRTHPLRSLLAPLWLKGGKAAFKARVASQVQLDAAHLPYNR